MALVMTAADPSQARRTRAHSVTPLHRLEVEGERCARVIELLCENGADPNAKAGDGTTPLAAALARDTEEVAAFLYERGAAEDPEDLRLEPDL